MSLTLKRKIEMMDYDWQSASLLKKAADGTHIQSQAQIGYVNDRRAAPPSLLEIAPTWMLIALMAASFFAGVNYAEDQQIEASQQKTMMASK